MLDYTPQVIDRWLREWELLESLAETPSSSAHLLGSECRHSDKACSNGRPVGIKDVRNHGDPCRYIDLLADIRGAAELLPPYSLESQVVAKLMSDSRLEGALSDRIHQIRGQLSKRYNDIWDAYHSACTMMARNLGWNPDEKTKAEGSFRDRPKSEALPLVRNA